MEFKFPFQSDQIDLLICDLIAAKKEFKPLIFDEQGHKNKYASIGAIKYSVEEALHKYNIEIEQPEFQNEKGHYLITRLIHKSGQWKGSISPIILDIEAAERQKISKQQAYGSALSYARRYALAALLNLKADDDDPDKYNYDNEDTNNKKVVYSPKVDVSPKINVAKIAQLEAIDINKKNTILKFYKVSKLSDLTESNYEAAKVWLKQYGIHIS